MTMLPVLDKKQVEFEKIVQHLQSELATLRTGRANGGLVENITVDYYGAPRQIAIQPYDKNALKDIEKAIQASNLGINPVNDGNYIRLIIPQMTEERRKELVKVVAQMAEKSRVAIRNVREEI